MDGVVQPPVVFFVLPAAVLLVRSLMIGVYVDGKTLIIVSWWRTYRFPAEQVTEVLIAQYSGYINRWADGDVMGRHVSVLGVEMRGADRLFPATAMTNAAAREVVPAIADALGVGYEVFPT